MTDQKKNDVAFKSGDHVVYPAHGVGRVIGVEKQHVAGIDLEVYVIQFTQDKMTLRVPTNRVKASGMRPLASSTVVSDAMRTLSGRARIKRTMWARRAQEYEAKINSGDLVSIAEVVRDLHRASDQPEQSYSERQLYENALDRMARELAAVENCDHDTARQRLAESLKKRAA
jgi:CarD family transcriptional regulator